MSSPIEKRAVVTNAQAIPETDIELGQWYWATGDANGPEAGGDEWFGCVTHIGSNYVQLKTPGGRKTRIHADRFYDQCRLEPNHSGVISGHVNTHQNEVRQLMGEVEALTARLGVGHTSALASGSEGAALAKLDPNVDVGGYKSSLVKAKKEELPALFKKIEDAHTQLAMWMKAETLPMRAQFDDMKGSIGRIDDRIFNVELYAGLTEEVVQVAEGEPAEMSEKIRLMQRRCYMDEECLAQYETGGMEFKDITEFDAWLARPANLDRLLPFPRCIVAFRVRRNQKKREIPHSMIGLFSRIDEIEWDKLTFLYIRNGDRLYRMNTELKFDAQMFPDTKHHHLTSGSKLWAKQEYSKWSIITDAQFQGLRDDYKTEVAEHKAKKAKHKADLKTWKAAKKAAEDAGEEFKEKQPWMMHHFWDNNPEDQYERFEPGNVYYDDIQQTIADEIKKYNRIGIIIQGLLDRSPVLHPHPPWKIWSEGGFEQALELVYDASRALVAGEKPDFEAYRKRLNESLKTGSVTVGQRDAYNDKIAEDRDREGKYYRYRSGDPGVDTLAQIVRYEPRKGHCNFAWLRDSETYPYGEKKIRAKFGCSEEWILNVDAYTPGDFRIFFSDPRTRAEYLQWAPMLLEAEEYHAGNRVVTEPPKPAKKESTAAGRRAYAHMKERRQLMGKTVKLAKAIETKGGKKFPVGSVWEVIAYYKAGLTIGGKQNEDGTRDVVSHVHPNDLIEFDPAT